MYKIIKFLFVRPIVWALKLVFKLALFAVVILCLILLAGNFWIPKATEITLTKMSGFKTNVDKSNGSVFKGRIDLEDFEIENPKFEFKNKDFISVNQITADVDMSSLIKDTIVIEELVLDIENITMVKNAKGVSNYSLFADNLKDSFLSTNNNKNGQNSSENVSKAKSIFIKNLVIALGTVHNIDESTGSFKEYDISYRREFKNVSSFSTLGAQLAGDLGKYGLSIVIDSVISSAQNLGGTAINKVIQLKDTSIDAAGKAGETITTGFKKLFGK